MRWGGLAWLRSESFTDFSIIFPPLSLYQTQLLTRSTGYPTTPFLNFTSPLGVSSWQFGSSLADTVLGIDIFLLLVRLQYKSYGQLFQDF